MSAAVLKKINSLYAHSTTAFNWLWTAIDFKKCNLATVRDGMSGSFEFS